jgi:ABC-type transport system involved in multi-copper enzyme maturation permease subunit
MTVNFFAITVFGLATFASAITEEKEDDTLGLLRMTRLNPLAILLGKSTARLLEGLLLLAVQVPFTMLCITLGGVSLDQVLHCYAILAAFVFLLCNVALLWSVVCHRTSRATSMTVLTGVAFYLLPLFLMPLAMTARFSGKTPTAWYQIVSQWSIALNPGFDLMRTVTPRGGAPFETDSIPPSLIGGAICFGLAWILFAPCCNTSGEAAPDRRKKTPGTSVRRRRIPRPGLHAIAWKDFHFLAGGWPAVGIRSVVYVGICILFHGYSSVVSPAAVKMEAVGWILWSFGWVAFSIELALVSARLFGSERKRNTLGSLYTLPRGTAGLVWEKILGALPSFIPSVALFCAGWVTLAQTEHWSGGSASSERTLGIVAFFLSQYVFFVVLAMYLSLRMRRAVLATAISLMFGGNMLLSLFGGHSARGGADYMFTESLLIWIATAVVASRIPRRIAIAAAGE